MPLPEVRSITARGNLPINVQTLIGLHRTIAFPAKLFERPECANRLHSLSTDSFKDKPTIMVLATGLIDQDKVSLAVAARLEHGMVRSRLAFVLVESYQGAERIVTRVDEVEVEKIIKLGAVQANPRPQTIVTVPIVPPPVTPPPVIPEPEPEPRPEPKPPRIPKEPLPGEPGNRKAIAQVVVERYQEAGVTLRQVYAFMKRYPRWEFMLEEKVAFAKRLVRVHPLPLPLAWSYVLTCAGTPLRLGKICGIANKLAMSYSIYGFPLRETYLALIDKALKLRNTDPVALEALLRRSLEARRKREFNLVGSPVARSQR
ncbi:MAG: hypothetical protein MUC35_06465 [Candidatus Margulisbacteria bacterium]|jgi:hypothetical protein|nr:hypothetical protein [Candidatus Margulisiibacteriota bacterium]